MPDQAQSKRESAGAGQPPSDSQLGSFGAAGETGISDVSRCRNFGCCDFTRRRDWVRSGELQQGLFECKRWALGENPWRLARKLASFGQNCRSSARRASPPRAKGGRPKAHRLSGVFPDRDLNAEPPSNHPDWVRSARRLGAWLWSQSQFQRPFASSGLGAEIGFVRPKSRGSSRPRGRKLASFDQNRAIRRSTSGVEIWLRSAKIARFVARPEAWKLGSFGQNSPMRRSAPGVEIGFVWPKSRGWQRLLICGLSKSEGRREPSTSYDQRRRAADFMILEISARNLGIFQKDRRNPSRAGSVFPVDPVVSRCPVRLNSARAFRRRRLRALGLRRFPRPLRVRRPRGSRGGILRG